MKQRLLHAYPTRLIFLIVAGITAVVIIQIQSLLGIPSRIRRVLN